MHAAAAAISVMPAAAAIAAAATRDAAGAILATDEPKARWAWPSSKKSGPRMPFLAAYLPRLSEVYSRTYECRASFRPATRGMVEVSPEVPSRMTPFCRCTKTGPGKAISTKCYTFSLFQSFGVVAREASTTLPGLWCECAKLRAARQNRRG